MDSNAIKTISGINKSKAIFQNGTWIIHGDHNILAEQEPNEYAYKIDIDFNLYELLMRVKDGYRPNKNDKYNYINFVEFVNKIQKLGSQSKEIYIEDKQGLSISNYRLVYNQEFETFEFKSTNEV